ncbi:GAF domain-containing protein [Mycolicibacterium komossense]|uniref:GAF domain-containing sensor histidine kinase n=1 Tax=Mycolicibacterium komossense TaxID=1779 RepID=UPI003F49074D
MPELSNRFLALLLRPTARPVGWGIVVAISFIAAEVVIVHQLKRVAPDNAFGAIFLLGVLVISAGWGFGLAVATSIASAAVYVYIHLEGSDSLAPALFVFLPVALLANLLAGQARLRAEEAEQRRREADLAATLARVMLRAGDLPRALEDAGRRMAHVLNLSVAALRLGEVPAEPGTSAIALHDGDAPIGTLLIPTDVDRSTARRLHRMIPALEALLAAACEREQKLRAAQREVEVSHAQVSALARQQTALRRVATLVARGADTKVVYPAAVAELADGLGAEHVTLVSYQPDDHCTVLAAHESREGVQHFPVGEPFPLAGDSLSTRIYRTAKPARIDDYGDVDGQIAGRLQPLGLRSGVGAPVIVDGQVRGALLIGSALPNAMPPDTETRVGDFADLVATAIANAETRSELTASRARIVAASDQARRRFERDLHDGAQQRIVSLGLELRTLQSSVPPELDTLSEGLTHAVDGLGGLYTDLQTLSRGLHPAILSKGGLAPAIKTLARRSSVPVRLDLDIDRRLAESIEVAAYYVVAEALTNAAKYAEATEVSVRVAIRECELHLAVSDDGVGGAVSGGGSGLIGLKDRVEALSGRLRIASPTGGGTTLTATIPTGDD